MKYFKGVVAISATVITYLLGNWDTSVIVLLAFLLFDYLSGCMCAAKEKKLSSNIGFKGLCKKLSIIFILISAVLLDRLMNNNAWVFRTLVCYFYIANEGLSILENSARLGVPIPEKLREILLQLKAD